MKKKQKNTLIIIGIILLILLAIGLTYTLNKIPTQLITEWDELGCGSSADGTDCYCCDEMPYKLETRYATCNNIKTGSVGANPLDVCGEYKEYMWACTTPNGQEDLEGNYECYGYVQGGYFYCETNTLTPCEGECNPDTGRCEGIGCDNPNAPDEGNWLCTGSGNLQECLNGNYVSRGKCSDYGLLNDCTYEGGYGYEDTCEHPTCTDTCSSLGYECGSWVICGTTTNCGNCGTDEVCKNGKCISDPTNPCLTMNCDDGNACTVDLCSDGTCYHTPIKCPPKQTCINGECKDNPCNNLVCTDECELLDTETCTCVKIPGCGGGKIPQWIVPTIILLILFGGGIAIYYYKKKK